MRIKITVYIKPLFFCFLLGVGSILAITPATRAESKPLEVGVEKDTKEVALRSSLTVKVTNLSDWLEQPDNKISKLILYIDGVALNDLKPSPIGNDKLKFDLRRTDKNKDAWTTLLSRKGKNFFYRSVPVTLGFENETLIPSNVNLDLIRIKKGRFYGFVFMFIVTIIIFLWLACKSDIIRDTGPQPTGLNDKGKVNRKKFSLGRTQMAFWFFTITAGYVFIWMVTSDLSSLTPGVLGLMGISAATGLGSAAVDSNKKSEQKNKLQVIDKEKMSNEANVEKLDSDIKTLTDAINAIPAPTNLEEQKAELSAKKVENTLKRKEIELADKKIRELKVETKPMVSINFIKDILSDDNGVSFHRFQIFVWTIVLIIIFFVRVYDILAMPTFDATLLALMGISSGTYIGFKLPDQQG